LELNPGLEAKTLFDHLQRLYRGKFSDGQLRSFQRGVRRWRALEGPPKEVFFAQEHRPGYLSQSDFTYMHPPPLHTPHLWNPPVVWEGETLRGATVSVRNSSRRRPWRLAPALQKALRLRPDCQRRSHQCSAAPDRDGAFGAGACADGQRRVRLRSAPAARAGSRQNLVLSTRGAAEWHTPLPESHDICGRWTTSGEGRDVRAVSPLTAAPLGERRA
jgi:hypothetical protein